MNILRTIVVGLASFICITAISGMIYILTLQTTVLDRNVVKGWLNESHIYDGRLMSLFVQNTKPANDTSSLTHIAPSPGAITNALNGTFSPNFVQYQAEKILDNAYDWMEGKTPNFSFSVPIDQKRDTLIEQLSKALEPQIAALPICTPLLAANNTACRPLDQTPAQYARLLTTDSIEKSSAFSQPLNNETVSQATSRDPAAQSKTSPLGQLPAIHSAVEMLVIALPITTVIAAAIVVFASEKGRRIRAAMGLFRRIFFGMLASFAIAVIVAVIMRTNNVAASLPGEISNILGPLLQIVIGDIALRLALISGIVTTLAGIIWVSLRIWLKKLEKPKNSDGPPNPVPAEPKTDQLNLQK